MGGSRHGTRLQSHEDGRSPHSWRWTPEVRTKVSTTHLPAAGEETLFIWWTTRCFPNVCKQEAPRYFQVAEKWLTWAKTCAWGCATRYTPNSLGFCQFPSQGSSGKQTLKMFTFEYNHFAKSNGWPASRRVYYQFHQEKSSIRAFTQTTANLFPLLFFYHLTCENWNESNHRIAHA